MQDKTHVRTLIKRLDYDFLRDSGIIPKVEWTVQTLSAGYSTQFPVWVKQQKSFCAYGMFIDLLIKQMLKGEWKQHVYNLAVKAYQMLDLPAPMKEDINQRFGTYTNIYKWVCLALPAGDYKADFECVFGNIQGHPDLVVGEYVFDIKTTSNFQNMEKETILQLLSYYSLLKQIQNIKYIGVVLPFQHQVLTFEPNFDCKLFIEQLESVNPIIDLSKNIAKEVSKTVFDIDFASFIFDTSDSISTDYVIGSHIPKQKDITTSLKDFVTHSESKFCQIFLRSPVNSKKVEIEKKDVEEATKIIKEYGLQFFTHASYIINLCNPIVKSTNSCKVMLSMVRRDLRVTNKIGGKGVVIHTGKYKELGKEEGLLRMIKFTKRLLISATKECPLLLETGASQGTEMLCVLEEFYDFLRGEHFSKEEKEKLYCCVDTCHVWASNYDPYEYLCKLSSLDNNLIRLVHFNNSKYERGCCKDGHAQYGTIPQETMNKVLMWCIKGGVPTIIE